MRVWIGTCGNRVALSRYVKLFSALEINATFYRFPTQKSLSNWEKVFRKTEGFLLSLKAFQGFTHPISSPTWRKSGLSREEIQHLKDQVGCLRLTEKTREYLRETLALCRRLSARYLLFQLPGKCQKEDLAPFFAEWRRLVPEGPPYPALEIRWEDPELLLRLWQTYRVVPAFDPLLFPEFLSLLRDLPRLYFRLHGERRGGRIHYGKKYTDGELLSLSDLLRSLRCEEVLVFFNNVYMHEDALRFLEIWKGGR